MKTLGFWIAGAVAVAVGYGFGASLPHLGMLLGAGAVVVAGFGSSLASTARRARISLTIAALGLLAGRGGLAAARAEQTQWRGPRGIAAGVRTLVVERASHPGPRCHVRVRSAGVGLWLDAPSSACPLAAGQRIRVRADRLRRHLSPELPGAPSPTSMARARGAHARATVDRVWPAGGRPNAYWAWVARQRQYAYDSTRGEPAAGFVVAAALGVRQALAPARRAALRRAGLGHLVAVSGLHVGLAAWVFAAASMRLGARLGMATLGIVSSWIVLAGYVLLTGASPPAVRATLMVVGVGLGGLWGRPHHGPVLLAVTCVGMLVVRPAWAFDPGFQLSVAAMAVLTRAPIDEGIVRQTWRVTWAVMPISLWHFGQAGLWGIAVNLVAIPVFTLWVLPLGMLGWCGGSVLRAAEVEGMMGIDVLAPAAAGARPILALSRWVADWPAVSSAQIAAVAGVALVLGVGIGRRDRQGRLRRGWRWLPPVPAAAAVVLVSIWPRPSSAIEGRWWVVGSPKSPAVVTLTEHRGHTVACVHRAAMGASRWPRLLEAMAVDGATWSGPEPTAPHAQALEDELAVRRLWVDGPIECPAPPPDPLARTVLTACRRRAAQRHAMVVMTEDGPMCFAQGQWRGLSAALLDWSRTRT